MDPKQSQFNGDGQDHRFTVTMPVSLGTGVVTFLLMHGVTIESASSSGDTLTVTAIVLGAAATLAMWFVIKHIPGGHR